MFLSVFEMFKVGIGPSSSHTMGPMVAAARFLETMRGSPFEFRGLQATLHGSLAFTGVGHATDRATILGLAGFTPESYDAARAEAELPVSRVKKPFARTGSVRFLLIPRAIWCSISAPIFPAMPTAWSCARAMPKAT